MTERTELAAMTKAWDEALLALQRAHDAIWRHAVDRTPAQAPDTPAPQPETINHLTELATQFWVDNPDETESSFIPNLYNLLLQVRNEALRAASQPRDREEATAWSRNIPRGEDY